MHRINNMTVLLNSSLKFLTQFPNFIFPNCYSQELHSASSCPFCIIIHQYFAARYTFFPFLLFLPSSCSAPLLVALWGIFHIFLQNFPSIPSLDFLPPHGCFILFLVFKYNIVTLIYDLSIFHPGNLLCTMRCMLCCRTFNTFQLIMHL